MTRRRYIAIASAALLLAGALYAVTPSIASGNKESCSAACRTSYGNCYKKSQDRAKCQTQLQRCPENCIGNRR